MSTLYFLNDHDLEAIFTANIDKVLTSIIEVLQKLSKKEKKTDFITPRVQIILRWSARAYTFMRTSHVSFFEAIFHLRRLCR